MESLHRAKRPMLFIFNLLIFFSFIILSGCLAPSKTSFKNETDSGVIVTAPKQLFLHSNQSEDFFYQGHKISLQYSFNYTEHIIEVTIDGEKEIVRIDTKTECIYRYCIISKINNNISYIIKPVVWRKNEVGEDVWLSETWDTKELYFEFYPKI